jgi:electron transfer flavoprotein beta subunit
MLAQLLGLPFAGNAVGLDIVDGALRVTRQGDAAQEIVDLTPPCLVTCSNDMNDPRIPSLKGIMAAKKKAIHDLDAPGLNEASSRALTTVVAIEPVPDRPAGTMLEGDPADLATNLVLRLRQDARVI